MQDRDNDIDLFAEDNTSEEFYEDEFIEKEPNLSYFKFIPPDHEYPLTEGEKINFRIKPRELVCDWTEKNITLVKPSYLYPGRFKPWYWQREPINAFNFWARILYVGAVQTFKSGITDCQAYYSQSVLGLNGMIAYVNEKKVTDAFDLRFVPMIRSKENKVLNEIWDKKDDSLTKNQLKLTSCTWKIASANNKDDIASFAAPITIGSEVGKWRTKEGKFNPITLLRGRSDAAFAMGDVTKNILESSPFEEGDLLYQETFREGTCILQPFYQCPYCKEWQVLSDHQIKLKDKELKYHPARIRQMKEEAVYYECVECKHEITEADRCRMSENVVWAMPKIDEEGFKQKAEKINKDGSIDGRLEGGVRLGYDTVCYWWSRLVDIPCPFYEFLARFFESLNDDERKKSYENETMARWWKKKTGRIEENYLNTRRIEYWQWGERHRIPESVLLITLGIDTQDDGFYYTFVGWGKWLTWLVLRQGFIACPRVEKGYEYQVFEKFMGNLYVEPLVWFDGSQADIIIGGIDRGGHRPDDVDFLVKHFPGGKLIATIGLTQKYEDRPMIYKSEKGNFYLMQSDPISEDVGSYISGDNFHLPNDVDREFIKQIGRQFHQKKVETSGKVTIKWIHNYQGPDHYRDALNINLAAAKVKNIDKILLNDNYCENLNKNRVKYKPIIEKKETAVKNQTTKFDRQRNSSYFNNLYGRLR